jgi:hypothetical protein
MERTNYSLKDDDDDDDDVHIVQTNDRMHMGFKSFGGSMSHID